jgi:hypothetical protein
MTPLVKPETTRKMFHALWDEMTITHRFEGPKPRLYVSKCTFPERGSRMSTALAVTDFADRVGGYRIQEHARYVAINGWIYPILDEEEMMYILIHEIAHCVMGLNAQHGPVFQDAMRISAGIAITSLQARRNQDYLDYLPRPFANPNVFLTPTLDDYLASA